MSIAAMPLERLEREITELASHIHAAMCRWLLLVAEFDRREGWGQWGSKSCADWVSWTCGIAPGAAREHVRVARRLSELPLLADAFSKGELSYSKMRALTRAATPENEVDLLMLARHGTAAHVERVVRCYRGAAAEALGQANRVHRDRYLSCEWEDDGSLVIRGRLPTEEGALLMQALERHLPPPRRPRDTRHPSRASRRRRRPGAGKRPSRARHRPRDVHPAVRGRPAGLRYGDRRPSRP